MSHLRILTAALQTRRPGAIVSIDDLRTELCVAAQIPGAQLGPLFLEAAQKGYPAWTGTSRKSTHKPAKGRHVLTYVVVEQSRTAA